MVKYKIKCEECRGTFERDLDLGGSMLGIPRLCDECDPSVHLLFGKPVSWWVGGCVFLVIVGFVLFKFISSFWYSEPTMGLPSDVGESVGHALESLDAGKKAGYEDCENHRYNGATANVNGWEREPYVDGYDDGYRECSNSRRAYEQGLADGDTDCWETRLGEDAYGDTPQLRDSSDYDNDYDRGYEQGFRSCK